MSAPAVGDLADAGRVVLLAALVAYPESAAHEEAERWLDGRDRLAAARELLAAARGAGVGAPARRLACQQTLSRLGAGGRTGVARGAGRPRAGRPRPGVAGRARRRRRAGAGRGDGLLADHRHPRRAAGRGRRPRAARATSSWTWSPGTRASSTPPGGWSTPTPPTSWRPWAACTRTEQSPRTPARPRSRPGQRVRAGALPIMAGSRRPAAGICRAVGRSAKSRGRPTGSAPNREHPLGIKHLRCTSG